jgi:hypothetical protein
MSLNYSYGLCGVFCEQCPSGNGKITYLASELLEETKNSFSWAEKLVDFSFEDLEAGLKWLTKQDCPGCLNIKEPWCEVLKCTKAKELKSCLLCEDYLTCPNTKYQRDRYPFVIDNLKRVQLIGLENHFKEEREKAEKGISLVKIRKY